MLKGCLPLAGITIVEMGGIGPGPFCASLLAKLGAEVSRVERPGSVPGMNAHLIKGQTIVDLDIKRPEGRAELAALLDRADILIEGFRPGVMERLGFGADDCLARNSRLIYARITGWGQDGPLAQTAGHDINYIALTGALHAIGPRDAPAIPLNLVGDFGAGSLYLAMGILAALNDVRNTGRGRVVETAIVDATASLMTLYYGMLKSGDWIDARERNRLDGAAPYYTIYATSDGRHMAVGALELPFYEELIEALDLIDLPSRDDPANWPELRRRFAAVFAGRPMREWAALFAATDACCTPVLTMAEALEHPHNLARDVFADDAAGVVVHAAAPAVAPRSTRA